jgi:hypothetical protein
VNDVSSEVVLQRLEGAEVAVRRALQTIERQIHLARSGSEDDVDETIRTVGQELELALAELRGTRPDAGATHHTGD